MENGMWEIRTYGLMRGNSHHVPEKLRFRGCITAGNPKGAQACAQQRRGVGLYSTKQCCLGYLRLVPSVQSPYQWALGRLAVWPLMPVRRRFPAV